MALQKLRWEYSTQGTTEGRIKEDYSSAHPSLTPHFHCVKVGTITIQLFTVYLLFLEFLIFKENSASKGVQQILGREGLSTSLPETPLQG